MRESHFYIFNFEVYILLQNFSVKKEIFAEQLLKLKISMDRLKIME